MEIDTPAGPSTFRPTPALGVTYLLDVDEEDIKIIPVVPLPLIHDPNDEDYDPRADQDIDDADEEDDDDPEDSEEGPPNPTPWSIVRGKRKATEVYDVDEEEGLVPRQSGWLHRKKARLGRDRKEPEYICISSDSEEDEDDIMEILKPQTEKKVKREGPPPKLSVAASKEESEQDEEPLDESSASPDPDPEGEMGSVERIRPNAPKWLEVLLAKSRKQHPRANIELHYYYSIEGDIWQVKCNACLKICSIGPGQSLSYFNSHLSGRSHQAAVGNFGPMPIPSATGAGVGTATARSSKNDSEARKAATTGTSRQAPRHTAGREPAAEPSDGLGHGRGPYGRGREKALGQNGGDDVERFLDQLGLSVDLAPKLRSFGFEDDRQMSLMGRLSDESLGLLLEHLTKQGVSLVTAIIVREGLKRRAGTL